MRGQTNASNIGGNVGSDTKPIKIVDGVATAVTNDLAFDMEVVHKSGAENISGTKTFTNIQGFRVMTSIPSYTTQSVGWGSGDMMFVAADGTQLGYIRMQQQGNARSVYVGIADTAGNVSWTPLHTVTL